MYMGLVTKDNPGILSTWDLTPSMYMGLVTKDNPGILSTWDLTPSGQC